LTRQPDFGKIPRTASCRVATAPPATGDLRVLPLNDYFDGLLKNLNPPEDRLSLAQDLPPIVRAHLERSDLLKTVAERPVTRLAGSYGRHTRLGRHPRRGHARVRRCLLPLESDRGGHRKQRRSCHVEFRHPGSDDPTFHIDVVPVIRPGDDPSAILEIPDREWTTWVPTQPLG
jgi:hypothetical protein